MDNNTMDLLLKNGIDPNKVGTYNTPLLAAISSENISNIRSLLDYGPILT